MHSIHATRSSRALLVLTASLGPPGGLPRTPGHKKVYDDTRQQCQRTVAGSGVVPEVRRGEASGFGIGPGASVCEHIPGSDVQGSRHPWVQTTGAPFQHCAVTSDTQIAVAVRLESQPDDFTVCNAGPESDRGPERFT